MSKGKRFFVIWFTAKDKEGEIQDGRLEISVTDGHFFNENEVKKQVKVMFGLDEAYISGFQELPESDFMEFLRGQTGSMRQGEGDLGNFL